MSRVLVFLFLGFSCFELAAQSRPNIILFLVDDLGWMDTSVPFGDSSGLRFSTPNLQRLAQTGTRFRQAYATPVCTPTRISLMTGMNAAQHGTTNWTSPQRDTPSDAPDNQFAPANWRYNGLSPLPGVPASVYATPLPQLLLDAGLLYDSCRQSALGPHGYTRGQSLQPRVYGEYFGALGRPPTELSGNGKFR